MESKRLGLYPRKRIDKGLADTGFIEGPTVKIEYRWANGDYDKWRCDCRHARRAEPLIRCTATSVPDHPIIVGEKIAELMVLHSVHCSRRCAVSSDARASPKFGSIHFGGWGEVSAGHGPIVSTV